MPDIELPDGSHPVASDAAELEMASHGQKQGRVYIDEEELLLDTDADSAVARQGGPFEEWATVRGLDDVELEASVAPDVRDYVHREDRHRCRLPLNPRWCRR